MTCSQILPISVRCSSCRPRNPEPVTIWMGPQHAGAAWFEAARKRTAGRERINIASLEGAGGSVKGIIPATIDSARHGKSLPKPDRSQ
eukprot:1915847-Rhodomonas_salina.1